MSFDSRAFRQALGLFPTGVAVVTACGDEGHPMGITVNSFTSVSLEPPLVLWCIDRKSDRHGVFTRSPVFVINILGTAHEEMSSRLAKQGSHRLDGIALLDSAVGPPALADALAVFECRRHAQHKAGDHTILIGEVERFGVRSAGAPLVFFRGRYGALAL